MFFVPKEICEMKCPLRPLLLDSTFDNLRQRKKKKKKKSPQKKTEEKVELWKSMGVH